MKTNEPADSRSLPPLALLAGGLAARLRPLTSTTPKSMLQVAGEPFIAHQLRLLAAHGIRNVVLCAGYLGEQIRDFVKDGSAFGCHVSYVFDGDRLRGTGGAIQAALPLLGAQFFIMYGDSYLPTSFARVYDFFCSSRAMGVMTVFRNEGRWGPSNVDFKDGQVLSYSKRAPTPAMKHIDYGLAVIGPDAFQPWAYQEAFDLASVYESLAAEHKLAGFEVQERFYEIGSWQGLEETAKFLTQVEKSGPHAYPSNPESLLRSGEHP